MREGVRRVTSVDVAREAGVSQATVSYVMNQNKSQSIPEDTRNRVMAAVRKLGYQPYAPARLLKTGKSKVILVIYPRPVIESGMSQLFGELAGAIENQGFSLVLQIGHAPRLEQLAANISPAVIVWLGDLHDPDYEILLHFKAPIISPDGSAWFRNGPRLQVEHLLRNGQRPIVYAATEKPQLKSMSESRLEIIRQVCRESGLSEPQVLTISQTRASACSALEIFMRHQKPPFAICAYNDDTAFAVLAALSDLQVSVPDDVSIIGHDNSALADFCIPPLTTIGLDSEGFSRWLVDSVISICQGGPALEPFKMDAKVIARASG